MVVDIWTECNGIKQTTLFNETVWRLIEAQENISTRKLVDSFEEQMILEEMVESSKPFIAKEYFHLHPLLYTPFRYPPLKHGSRFGKKTEPSLWYGSLEMRTAMAEKAFYQFNFIRASKAKYGIVEQPLTIFSARVKTESNIKLFASPFSDYTTLISSPDSYEASQKLGSAMREANIQAFSYQSARDQNNGINVALFTPQAFLHKKPDAASFQSWSCISSDELVEFISTSSISINRNSFPLNQFMINGALPFPAN
jgi:hypothetical protein